MAQKTDDVQHQYYHWNSDHSRDVTVLYTFITAVLPHTFGSITAGNPHLLWH